MKYLKTVTLHILVLCLLVLLPSPLTAWSSPTLTERINWSASYLDNAVFASGRFIYSRSLFGKNMNPERYNFLRHAGTLYAMALYHEVEQRPYSHDAIRRAAHYLHHCCLDSVNHKTDMLALWSPPELTGKPQASLQAKLGGSGLALVALIQVENITPGLTKRETLQNLGNFIMFMQNQDGSFTSKYFPNRKDGKYDGWHSLYYPGEAAFGLIMLYQVDGDLRWLEVAIDALRYLARKREDQSMVEADHWALIATKHLFELNAEALTKASPANIPWNASPEQISIKKSLMAHAEKVVESILSEQIQNNPQECLNGGFNQDGRIAPTATRLEGLLAALSFLPSGRLYDRVLESVKPAMQFLAAGQVTAGPYKGAFTRYNLQCSPVNERGGEIRIDYVQHALLALIGYRDLLNSSHP